MSVPISLEPALDGGKAPPPTLGQLIVRITHERGSFAQLNESELEDAIFAAESDAERELAANADASAGAGAGAGAETPTAVDGSPKSHDVPVAFTEQRRKLSAAVNAALNESALNLDFVSLLVSATRPEAGASTMSPALRAQVSPSSMGVTAVQLPAPALGNTAGYGWKIEEYAHAEAQLEAAAERLATESALESRFWLDILETVRAGEIVNSKLQIRYGFDESGSAYRDSGIARVVRRSDGHAEFVPARRRADKWVQVSVYSTNASADAMDGVDGEQLRLVGRATLPDGGYMGSEIMESIARERHKLFEEELMYNMIQETRSDLTSRRVRITDQGALECALFGGTIVIELVDKVAVPPDADPSHAVTALSLDDRVSPAIAAAGEAANPAVSIVYALHLLQIAAYARALADHRAVPPPLASKSANTEPERPAILGPLLAFVEHGILVNRALKLFDVMRLQAVVESNGARAAKSLLDAPRCVIVVEKGTARELVLEIGSTDAREPEFRVNRAQDAAASSVNDLVELESWLRWATSE